MGGRPLFAAMLSILCGIAGTLGAVYFTTYQENYPVAGACAAVVIVAMGLWQQSRWAWWVGFALLSGILTWNWNNRELINEHVWFLSGLTWVYFVIVFKEYN